MRGKKSEKAEVFLPQGEQHALFNEAEKEAEVEAKRLDIAEVKAHKRTKRTRDELAESLFVKEVLHTVEDRVCEKCRPEMTVVGKEKVRDKLVYVPARLYIRRHVAEVVKCPQCGSGETNDDALPDAAPCRIRCAEILAPLFLHIFCAPELLMHIVCEKYRKAAPLY